MAHHHVIIAGQSNALGFGNTGAAPYTPTWRVQIWADTNNDGWGDAWNYMNPGVNTGTLANPNVWGPEVEFANQWLADNADGVLWIVKEVKGSTGLAADSGALDWSPNSAGEMFDAAAAEANAARNNLSGGQYHFDSYEAVLWMQGEEDALSASKASSYEANLRGFLDDVRNEWMNDEDGLVIAGRIADSPTLTYGSDVRLAQWNVDLGPGPDPMFESFKTIGFGMQSDGIHYSAAGHVQLGASFYTAFDGWY